MRLYSELKKQTLARILLEGLKLSERPDWAETAPWDPGIKVLRCFAYPPNGEGSNDDCGVIRLETGQEGVFVCEAAFEGAEPGGEDGLFAKSAVDAKDYKFGAYIKPVFFVTGDVDKADIAPEEGTDGIRVIENDERFYVDCLSAGLAEKYEEYALFSVRSMFEALTKAGKMTKQENGDYLIFKDSEGKAYALCRHFRK